MSIFSRNTEEVVVFSAMEGSLTHQGNPAAGATIVRWSRWKDSEGEFETITADAEGRFSFNAKKAELKKGLASAIAQFVVTQEITVTYEGQDYVIWTGSKDKKEAFGEFGGAPSDLRCELTDEPQPVRQRGVLLLTSCKWESTEGNHNDGN